MILRSFVSFVLLKPFMPEAIICPHKDCNEQQPEQNKQKFISSIYITDNDLMCTNSSDNNENES